MSAHKYRTLFAGVRLALVLLLMCGTLTLPVPRSVSAGDVSLPLPWITQYQGLPSSNCDSGPASIAMILRYYGLGSDLTDRDLVDQVRTQTRTARICVDTGFKNLEDALTANNRSYTEITKETDTTAETVVQAMADAVNTGRPVIGLVNGKVLNRSYNYHWLVIRGFSADGQQVYLSDPDEPRKTYPTQGWIKGGPSMVLSRDLFRQSLTSAYSANSKKQAYGIIVGDGNPLNVLDPVTNRPAFADMPSKPAKIVVKLAYPYSLETGDVQITVGGQPARIITIARANNNVYILDIQPPTQPSVGTYDLTVNAKGHRRTQSGAVSYNGVSIADVILTLDRSGSMSIDNKMPAAHNAARQFVDLMQVGDGVGVVGFNNRATTAFPLTVITDPPPLSSMVFSDTMESGTGKWTPDPPWGLTSVAYRGSAAWTDSPAGNYANNVNSALAITDPVAIPVLLSAPALSFWHRYDIENGFDYGRVEVSTDNGATWQSLAAYTGVNTTWSRAVIDLSAYRGQTIRLRFRLTTNAYVTRDGWYIDDVTVGPAWVDARAGAIAAIGTLTPLGGTSIGGGLQRSQQLLSTGASDRRRAIVLLSDGQENTAPYVSDVLPQIRASQITVHTIGLGTDADQQLLLSIAAQTGGTYNYAPRPDQLAGIYNTISGAVSNRQTLITTNGTIAIGTTVTNDVTIDSSVSEATFWSSWTNPGAGVTFSLQTPGGVTIDAASAATSDDIDYVSGSTYAYYRVRAPTLTPGVWRILLSRAAASSATIIDEPAVAASGPPVERPAAGLVETVNDVTPDLPPDPAEHVVEAEPVAQPAATGDEPFVARVLARANLTMGFYLGKITHLTTEPMTCIVTLADNAPVTGATVLLRVTLPGQPNALNLPLYDDGRHGDGAAGDGVYATTFIGPFTPGTATFSVVASGQSSVGEPFIRQGELSTYVATNPNPYTFVHLPLVVR